MQLFRDLQHENLLLKIDLLLQKNLFKNPEAGIIGTQ